MRIGPLGVTDIKKKLATRKRLRHSKRDDDPSGVESVRNFSFYVGRSVGIFREHENHHATRFNCVANCFGPIFTRRNIPRCDPAFQPVRFELSANSASDLPIFMCVADENLASHPRTLPNFGIIQRRNFRKITQPFTKTFLESMPASGLAPSRVPAPGSWINPACLTLRSNVPSHSKLQGKPANRASQALPSLCLRDQRLIHGTCRKTTDQVVPQAYIFDGCKTPKRQRLFHLCE